MLAREQRRSSLGERLRALRKKKGLTGTVAAERIGISQSKLSKVESGALLPSVEDVKALCAEYGLLPRKQKALLELLRVIRTEYSSWRVDHGHGLAPRQDAILEQEDAATSIRVFQPTLIPGLLQVAEYAKCVLLLSNVTGQKDVDHAVLRRLERQRSLYDRRKRLQLVITETALRSRFCPTRVVERQMQFLSTICALPNVTLGIIPGNAPLPRIPLTPFVLYDSTIVILETTAGTLSLSDERDIHLYEAMFEDFLRSALTGCEAADFLRRNLELGL